MDPSLIERSDARRDLLTVDEAEAPGTGPSSGGLVPSLSLIWDHRRLVFKFAVCGFLIFTAIAFLIPKTYKSTTQIMPPDNQSSAGLAMITAMTGGSGSSGLGSIASSLLGMKNTGELFIGVLQSRTVQDRIIDKFDLRSVYRLKRYDQTRKKLAKETEIVEDRKSQIISVTVYDNDPNRAAAIAKEYVSQLDILMAQLSTSAAHRERVFLEERLKVVKQELDQSAKEFSQFASNNATLDIQQQGKAMLETAASLQGQLIAAESELKGLEQIYTPNNVRVQSIQARIDELKRKQQQALGSSGAAPGNKANSDFPYPPIRQLPLLGVKYADLYREAKIDEAVYETLTKEYELARVQEAKEIPTVKVLDVADVPEKKAGPPRSAIMLLGAAFSAAIGMLWILGRKHWDELPDEDESKVLLINIYTTFAQVPAVRSINNFLLRRKDRDD